MKDHVHNDPTAVLPLFKLMTLLDPGFTAAWTEGGSILARDRSDAGTDRAAAFLREGLEKNPQSIELLTELGGLYLTRRKDYHGALPILDKARVEGDKRGDKLNEDQKDALLSCYRYIALSLRNLGRHEDQKAIALEGLKKCGQDAVLERLAQ